MASDKLVPEAEKGLDKMKQDVAREVGVKLDGNYNGDIKAKDAGKIGGNMVKKLIQKAENDIAKSGK